MMNDYPTISNTKASDGAKVTLVGDGKIDGVEAKSSTVLLSNEKAKPLWKNWSAIGCAIGIIGLIAVFVF